MAGVWWVARMVDMQKHANVIDSVVRQAASESAGARSVLQDIQIRLRAYVKGRT